MLTFGHVIAQFCYATVRQNNAMKDWSLSLKELACELNF